MESLFFFELHGAILSVWQRECRPRLRRPRRGSDANEFRVDFIFQKFLGL